MSTRRVELLIVAGVLLFAVTLRAPGLYYGFPLIVHPDEPRVADAALGILARGDLHPRTLLYPSFSVYLSTGVFAAVDTLAELRGSPPPAPADYYFWGRVATLVLALLTVLQTYLIARSLAGGAAAAAAATVAASSLLHASNSFFITTDIPTAFWTTAALSAALALARAERAGLPAYLAAGAMVGASASTKYNGVFVAAAVAAAHWSRTGARLAALIDVRLFAAAAASIATFFAITPFAALDFPMFKSFIELQSDAYTANHAGHTSDGTSYGFYAGVLVDQVGVGTLLSAALGCVSIARRSFATATVLLAFPVVYFAFMGAYPVHFARNLVPLVPPLAILAGIGVQRIVAARFRPDGVAAIATALLLAGVVSAPQALASWRHTRELALPDTRVLAKQWIEANLPAGVRIAREQYTPPLDENRFDTTALGYFGLARATNLDEYDYLIASSRDYQRFFAQPERHAATYERYRTIFERYRLIHRIAPVEGRSNGPVIRVLATR